MKFNFISLAPTIVFIACTTTQPAKAQYTPISDSSFRKTVVLPQRRVSMQSFITPVSIFSFGVAVNAKRFLISDMEIKEDRDERFKNFRTRIDDYLQFAPIAAGYAMMIDHPEHEFWPFTKKSNYK